MLDEQEFGKPQSRGASEAAEQQPVDDGLIAFAEGAADVSAERGDHYLLRWLRNLASHAACFQFAGPTLHYMSGDFRLVQSGCSAHTASAMS